MVNILDGKILAKIITNHFLYECMSIASRSDMFSKMPPHLVIYHINNMKSSQIYIEQKVKFANKININVSVRKYNESCKKSDILENIHQTNNDPNVTSIIVQMPVTFCANSTENILDFVNPIKDVDSLGSYNRKLYFDGNFDQGYIPPTVYGVLTLLASQQSVKNNRIAVVGQGPTLGQPCSVILEKLTNEIVKIDANTPNIEQLCSSCDIVISASGISNHITSHFIKNNAGIIDGGSFDHLNHISSSSVCMDDITSKASWISPSPGGLGPLTVRWLFYNVCLSYAKQNSLSMPNFNFTLNKLISLFKSNSNTFKKINI